MNSPTQQLGWPDLLHTTRVPCVLLIGTAGALVFAPASRDMLGGLWAAEGVLCWPAIELNLMLLLLGLGAWHWARASLSARFCIADTPEARKAFAGATGEGVDLLALDWAPRVLFGLAGGAALALSLPNAAVWRSLASRWPSHLLILAAWAACAVFIIWRSDLPRWLGGGDRTRTCSASWPGWLRRLPGPVGRLWAHAPFGPYAAAVLVVVALVLCLAGLFGSVVSVDGSRVALPVLLGRAFPSAGAALFGAALALAPLATLAFWVGYSTSQITILGLPIRLRWLPANLMLIVLGIAGAAHVNLHAVRIVPFQANQVPAQRKRLQDMWTEWARACGGAPAHPVIVAVSGGASRAGLWAARILFTTDGMARDAHTGVFAVSSVSGGSLGAAGYLAWLRGQGLPPCGGVLPVPEALLRRAAGADALGPLLAAALFADVPRAIAASVLIPVDWVAHQVDKQGLWLDWIERRLRGGDRADALERAFEANWHEALKGEPTPKGEPTLATPPPFALSQSYLSLYGEGAERLPLWLANGTDQQHGERLLTVPFGVPDQVGAGRGAPMGWPFDGAKDALGIVGADLAMATVIDNTARFPFLSPTGELTPGPAMAHVKHPPQIIDGGYFDNEGLQTALDLADWMRNQGSDPIVVQVTSDAEVADAAADARVARCTEGFADHPDMAAGARRANQAVGPLMGLDGVRAGHGGVTLRHALDLYCDRQGERYPEGGQRFFHLYLFKPDKGEFPLNWSLSDVAARGIWGMQDAPSNRRELSRLWAALRSPPPGPPPLAAAFVSERPAGAAALAQPKPMVVPVGPLRRGPDAAGGSRSRYDRRTRSG